MRVEGHQIGSYCLCYTSSSAATEDFFNVFDVKFIFKKRCNSWLMPAQIFATVHTCDTAVAANAYELPSCSLKWERSGFALLTVRNQQSSVGNCVVQFRLLRIKDQTDVVCCSAAGFCFFFDQVFADI